MICNYRVYILTEVTLLKGLPLSPAYTFRGSVKLSLVIKVNNIDLRMTIQTKQHMKSE